MRFLYSKNNVYSTRCFLYNYNGEDFRLVKIKSCRNSGFEDLKKSSSFDYNSDEVKRISLSRTKRNIRELALCNDFTYFCTFTVNSEKCDRYNLDVVQDKIRKIFKKIKRYNKDFKFLIITEKHKDGAYHFHGLIKGITDLVLNDNGYYSSIIFNNELGFNSFSKILDYNKCCNYILKYITKDCIKNSKNQIYFCSRGLKKAIREEFTNFDFEPSFSNDFVELKDFNINDMSNTELLDFIKNFK